MSAQSTYAQERILPNWHYLKLCHRYQLRISKVSKPETTLSKIGNVVSVHGNAFLVD
ncbi:MAG: hypothetical protein RMY35_033040 [Nostoc sp. DedSLP01]